MLASGKNALRARLLAEARRQKQRADASRLRRDQVLPAGNPFDDDSDHDPATNRMLIAMQQATGSEGFQSRMAQFTPLVALSGRHQPRLQKAMLLGSAGEFAYYVGRRGWAWFQTRDERQREDQYVVFTKADSDAAQSLLVITHAQSAGQPPATRPRALQITQDRAWMAHLPDGTWVKSETLDDDERENLERSLITSFDYRADEETHALTLTLPSGQTVQVRQQFGKPGQEPAKAANENGAYVYRDFSDYLVLSFRGEETLHELKSFIESLFPPVPRRNHTPSSDLFVYTSKLSGWEHRSRENSRPLDSVTLREGQAERILDDIREFLKSERDYVEYGVTWRRGVLLYGEPGGGKTSFVRAMATSLGIDVYYLSLKTVTSNEALQHAVSHVDQRSIIVLEDVDVVAPTREGQHSDDRVTLDVLLNVLDGMLTPHGAMFFMTTNDLTKLDPALVRPGRVDLRMEIVELDDYQVAAMCRRFFGRDIGVPSVRRKIMPAELADVFKRYLRNREGAVDEVIALFSNAE